MKTDDLIHLLARQPAALPRPMPRRDLMAAVALGAALAATLMLIVLGPRAGLAAAVATPLFAQKIGALLVFALLSAAVAFRAGQPGRTPGVPGRWRWAVPAWWGLATLVVALLDPAGDPLAQFRSGTELQCLVSIPLLSLPAAVALGWAVRRGAPTAPPAAATAIGLAAGGIGALAYAFHCPQDAPGYLLLWYGLAVAATTLLVRATAPRWLRW